MASSEKKRAREQSAAARRDRAAQKRIDKATVRTEAGTAEASRPADRDA